MKNFTHVLTACLIALFTSYSVANAQSSEDENNSRISNLITKVKNRKEKKYEFYASYFRPNFITKEYTEWGKPTTKGNAFRDSVYYTIQQQIKTKDKIVGTPGISFGVNKIDHLNNKLNLKYGVGFTIFGFKHLPVNEVLQEVTLKKYTVIDKPVDPTILVEKLGEENPYEEIFTGSLFMDDEPKFEIAAVSIPLSLEYKIHEKLLIGGDVSFTFPIKAEESKSLYDYKLKDFTKVNVSSNKISKMIPQFGVHFKLNIDNYYYALVNVSTGRVLKNNELKNYYFNESDFSKLSPFYYSYGLTFGVNL